MASIVYRVRPSSKETGHYGVFECMVYEDAPTRIGEEISTHATIFEADRAAEEANTKVP